MWEGHDLCVIADGQSGAGKSYTMLNGPDAIATSAATQICSLIQTTTSQEQECRLHCSVLEIYKEKPRDLLAEKNLPAKNNVWITRCGTAVRGLTDRAASLADEFSEILRQVCMNRKVGATDQNAVSSRGHLVIILTLQRSRAATVEAVVETTESKLTLVDLADSEQRPSASEDPEAMAEATSIMKDRESLKRLMLSFGKSSSANADSQVGAFILLDI